MPTVARTVGGPGAGKTTRAMQILEKILEKTVQDPLRIGFVSFTRAARREASARAALKFNIPADTLEKEGWFRTLHSVAYKQLGVSKDQLLTATKDDNEWLKNTLQDESVRVQTANHNEDFLYLTSDLTDSGRALMLWDVARNRLCSLDQVWDKAAEIDRRIPDLSTCHAVVSSYEDAKRRDDRLDFCDLLMRFAGKRWSGKHEDPFDDVTPEGDVPILPVWFHDEMQDSSALCAVVFRRLTQFSNWVYLFGDRDQSIYSWGGADGEIFANWKVAKEEVLPISYRCRSDILEKGNKILRKSQEWRKQFRAEKEGGVIEYRDLGSALEGLKPGQDVLVLGRTNDQAREASSILTDNLTPWKTTKVHTVQQAPARFAAIAALCSLRNNGRIDGNAIHRMLDQFPVKANGVELFIRGTKSWFDNQENRDKMMACSLAESDMWGATEAFKNLVSNGRYKELLDKPTSLLAASAEKHGVEAVGNPTIRIGTCHSSKGQEADHVILMNDLPYPTQLAMETEEGMEEERRVWYVSCTRARHRLTICNGDGVNFPDL